MSKQFVLFLFLTCELFPAFNSANKIGNLTIICFGVNIFNPCPFCLCADFSSVYNGGMSLMSTFSVLPVSVDCFI